MSNLDEDQDIKDAHKYGATQYVLKASLSPSELIAKVKYALEED
jgi:DNA-binding NarL/FixJ family response regulator